MADPNVASNLGKRKKPKGQLSTQPLSTGSGASASAATRPPKAKAAAPFSPGETPGRRYEAKKPKGPSPRAMERANPNASFKRTGQPVGQAKSFVARKVGKMPKSPMGDRARGRALGAAKKLPRPVAKAKRPMYGTPRTYPKKAKV